MKFLRRNSAGSIPSFFARMSTILSIVNAASVTRNEHRYAIPPGGLFVYTPSTSTCAFSKGYDPVMMWKSPAGNFDGFAAASVYPWSAIVFTRRALSFPSFVAPISASMW